MAIAGELINLLGFKLEGEGNLKKFNDGMDGAESSAKKQAASIKRLGIAAGVTTAGMVAMGTAAFKNAAAFERTMGRIGITAGASSDAVKGASETVLRLARDFALPIDQAVAGLDTLTASGLSLEEAMAFLPSVLATAQASGAATEDIANTALKAASALKIEAKDMQNAFDIMVAGGKAGQFELRDMASYIPNLANTFANLGYTGEEGLQKLIAILQTVRMATGEASSAATNAGEIFGKMLAPSVVKNFSGLGTDIKAELESAKAAGEDLMQAYVRISQETMKNNPKATLVDLFSDKQMREGMLALMSLGDKWKEFRDAVSDTSVSGGVFRDLNTVLDDTQTKIDRLSTTWDMFSKAIGAKLSGPIGDVLNAGTDWVTFDDAISGGLRKRGLSYDEEQTWRARNWLDSDARALAAREGGYAPTAENQRDARDAPDAYRVLGRRANRPVSTTPNSGSAEAPPLNPKLEAIIAGMNANLAGMAAATTGTVSAPITDARQDNRSFPVTVGGVTVNVRGPDAAPGATGAAVGAAIGKAAVNPAARMESEPSQP